MFNQRHKARKASLARGHLLAHHARVAVAKQKNQPALRDGCSAYFRRPPDGRQFLLAKILEQLKRLVEILFRSTHFVEPICQTDRNGVNPQRFLRPEKQPFQWLAIIRAALRY